MRRRVPFPEVRVRRWSIVGVAVVLVGAHAGVAAAATPRDGGWKAAVPGSPTGTFGQVNSVSLAVGGGGKSITATNSLLPGSDDCEWGGPVSPGPVTVAADGSFSMSNTAGGPTGGGGGAGRVDVTGQFTSPTQVHLTVTLSQCLLGDPPEVLQLEGSLVQPAVPLRTVPCGGLHTRAGRILSITARGYTCADARGLLAKVLRARDEALALADAGLEITRVRHRRLHGKRVYGVGAEAGGSVIGYVRVGSELRVDHRLYRAGQQLVVAGVVAPGAPASNCTAAFVLALPQRPPVGLTAGHCAHHASLGEPHTVFRSIDAGGPHVLGHEVGREPNGIDAMVFSVRREVRLLQQIERGDLPPLAVAGTVPDGEQTPGKAVCFAGRSSGADQCGRIAPNSHADPGLICTDIRGREGDSGGPVYEDTGSLVTRALGITTEQVGRHHVMCYTPIGAILQGFGATFPPGPEVPNGIVF
jgi:hypothetical protein